MKLGLGLYRHQLNAEHYRFARQSDLPQAVEGYHACSSSIVGILFGVCTILLIAYQINKRMTIQMADELAERRKKIITA